MRTTFAALITIALTAGTLFGADAPRNCIEVKASHEGERTLVGSIVNTIVTSSGTTIASGVGTSGTIRIQATLVQPTTGDDTGGGVSSPSQSALVEVNSNGVTPFSITFSDPMSAGYIVRLSLAKMDSTDILCFAQSSVDLASLDWGRTRVYFHGGVLYSKRTDTAGSGMFQDPEPFLALSLETAWLMSECDDNKAVAKDRHAPCKYDDDAFKFHWMLMDSFDIRLTSAGTSGVTTQLTAGTSNFATATSVMFQSAAYMPTYFKHWDREGDRRVDAAFIAPIAKFGYQGIRILAPARADANSPTKEEQIIENRSKVASREMFQFFSYGVRIGHLSLPPNRNRAPDLLSYLDVTWGKWKNLRNFPNALPDDTSKVPTRLGIEGRLKLPSLPFIIGFDSNTGPGPDEFRFIFGTRLDLGNVLKKLIPTPAL